MTKKNTGYQINEKDIEATLNYLKLNGEPEATRDDAIQYLEEHQVMAHVAAHKIVEDEQKDLKEENKQANTKFVYFDLGGVVFHFRGGLQKLAKKHSLEYSDFEKVFRIYNDAVCRGEITSQELWNHYKNELGFEDDEISDFANYWVSNFESIPQTKQLMVDCSKQYKVGLITNIYEGVFPKILDNELLPNINWDAQVHSCEVGYVKPESEIFEIAIAESGVKPNEIFFIDDKNDFVEAAKRAGMRAYQFNTDEINKSISEIRSILAL